MSFGAFLPGLERVSRQEAGLHALSLAIPSPADAGWGYPSVIESAPVGRNIDPPSRLYRQGMIVGSATAAGFMLAFSFLVVDLLIPAGHRLQQSEIPLRRRLGRLATIGMETCASLALLSGMAAVYGWDRVRTLQTGLLMGVTQGIPLSTISRRWGKRPYLSVAVRQAAMAAIQANVAVMNSLGPVASSGVDWGVMGEVAGFNLVVTAILEAAARFRQEKAPGRPTHPTS